MTFGNPDADHNPVGGGIVMGKKGRAGLVLPFDSMVAIAGFGMTVILCTFCLIVWGISYIWHPLCWSVTGYVIVRFFRRAWREHKEAH